MVTFHVALSVPIIYPFTTIEKSTFMNVGYRYAMRWSTFCPLWLESLFSPGGRLDVNGLLDNPIGLAYCGLNLSLERGGSCHGEERL